jgi:predicted phage terminase large subunit-like protein
MKYGKSENQFPDFDFILGVVDTAFTAKQENDFTAMVVLGIWADLFGLSKIMLMHFWQKRLRFNDAVEEIVKSARKLKCDRVLIENKASGISIYQETVRLTREEEFALQLVNPGAEDKEARANSVSHLFREEYDEGETRDGLIYVPCKTQDNGAIWPREWAEDLMSQMAAFPKGKHDDGVDACVYGLRFLRARGLIRRPSERAEEEARMILRGPGALSPPPLYGGLGRSGLH